MSWPSSSASPRPPYRAMNRAAGPSPDQSPGSCACSMRGGKKSLTKSVRGVDNGNRGEYYDSGVSKTHNMKWKNNGTRESHLRDQHHEEEFLGVCSQGKQGCARSLRNARRCHRGTRSNEDV